MVIKTVKTLKEQNTKGQLYKLNGDFSAHRFDGQVNTTDLWEKGELFTFDGELLTSENDGSQITPRILFQSKVTISTVENSDKK